MVLVIALVLGTEGCASTQTSVQGETPRVTIVFSDKDRKIILDYFRSSISTRGMPPGLAKRDRLPPGLERQLVRKGTLPPGLRRYALPSDLGRLLSALPRGQSRFRIGGKVLLFDEETSLILDIIDLML